MCNCNNVHKVQTATVSGSNLVLAVTNSTNISSLDCFKLLVCKNIGATVTTAPIPVQITINGTAVALNNKYGVQIYSNELPCRKMYCGSYVVPSTGSPYVILFNTPSCKCDVTIPSAG